MQYSTQYRLWEPFAKNSNFGHDEKDRILYTDIEAKNLNEET